MSDQALFIIFSPSFAALGFAIFMIWRNEAVYRARIRAVDVISGLCLRDIRERGGGLDAINYWYGTLDEYPSYNRMVWMFTKWRFAQFYPELERLRKEAA